MTRGDRDAPFDLYWTEHPTSGAVSDLDAQIAEPPAISDTASGTAITWIHHR